MSQQSPRPKKEAFSEEPPKKEAISDKTPQHEINKAAVIVGVVGVVALLFIAAR